MIVNCWIRSIGKNQPNPHWMALLMGGLPSEILSKSRSRCSASDSHVIRGKDAKNGVLKVPEFPLLEELQLDGVHL